MGNTSAMQMKNEELTKAKLKSWKLKVTEMSEQNEYLEPYPPEMRREFLKHDLNPITGFPSVTSLVKSKLDINNDLN